MPPSRDATKQIILETLDGVQVWLGEWSATARALFLPTGLLDWLPSPAEPDNAPPGRIRSYVVDRVLQFVDENGAQGVFGELISTDANGIRRVIPPGDPGAILVSNPSAPTRVSWSQSLTVSEIAGQHQAGSRWHYQGSPVQSPAGEVQYTRVEFAQDTVINSMSVYRALGGNAARFVNIGIYDQADPGDASGVPRTLLAETGPTATTGTNSYISPSIGPLVIPATGFYWLAFVTDTASPLTWATTAAFPPDFLPVFREVSAGTTLPATAGGLANPASAVAFVAALE